MDAFFLIDFGIVSGYSVESKQEPKRDDGIFNGTQDFVSLRVMRGEDVSRRCCTPFHDLNDRHRKESLSLTSYARPYSCAVPPQLR